MWAKESELINAFHKLYYYHKGHTWGNTHWLGIPIQKCPLDLWIYQEILFEVQPDLIIECGTASGGSALFLASLCDLLNHGIVISVDIAELPGRPSHSRITYLKGSSTSQAVLHQIQHMAANFQKVIVILDSDHHCSHVLEELHCYSSLVTLGSYLIVEDTNLNGHPVAPEFGPGPREAIELFLLENKDFKHDQSREKFMITANANGFLRRTMPVKICH